MHEVIIQLSSILLPLRSSDNQHTVTRFRRHQSQGHADGVEPPSQLQAVSLSAALRKTVGFIVSTGIIIDSVSPMPKIHEYSSGEGYYLKTSFAGNPITLQVSPEAETLIQNLNLNPGDDLPREVLKPLILLEDIYTKSDSIDKIRLYEDTPSISGKSSELQEFQRSILKDYIMDEVNELITTYSLLRDHLNNQSNVFTEQWDIDEPSTSSDNHDAKIESENRSEIDVPSAFTDVPLALRIRDQWVNWGIGQRNGKPQKIPTDPKTNEPGKVNDPDTWGRFRTAVESWKNTDVEGLGFVFTDDDTLAGVDLDDVRDPDTGKIETKARDIINSLDSYTEISPSGTGVHVLVKGFKPPGRTRNDDIEMYDRDRYFTVTGNHLEGTPKEIEVRQDELRAVHADYLQRNAESDASGENEPPSAELGSVGELPSNIEPEEILERAKRNDKFQRLWKGDHSGYPSHSEADMALCCSLAYRTGGDKQLMDDLFRRSGLMRPKWDAERGDQTYGEMTLQKAVQFVDDIDPYLTEDESRLRDLSELEPGDTATIKVEVKSTQQPSVDPQTRSGRVKDQTGELRFARWGSEESASTELIEGKEYRLENVRVTTFEGRKEIHINEHTTVVQTSD